jgi:hypothetical protein
MGTGGPFPGGKAGPGRDADHSPPSSAEVKYEKWIFYDNVIRKSQWCRPGEAPKSNPKKNLHSKKLIIFVWWDVEGIYTSSYDPTKP